MDLFNVFMLISSLAKNKWKPGALTRASDASKEKRFVNKHTR